MKLCPYPFSRLQTSNYADRFDKLRGTFLPCVPSWFKDNYFDIPSEETLDDIWNGKQAVELRKKMYEGDFSFCNREACQIPLYTVDELADRRIVFAETPIPDENIEAIKRKDPIMPNGPSSLYLTSDFTCNLKCPICRSEVIPNSAPTQSAIEEYDYVHRSKDALEVIKMSNGGEVFYSTLQRKLLKSLNNVDFPKLRRVHIVSNGTLFSKKAYKDLAPGTHFIKDVNISLDAGTKEVYEKVRGPYWEQVVENVHWLGEMRKEGKLDYYSFHIIITKDNYKDIPQMIQLAKDCNVDRVLIQPFLKGPDQGYKNYEEQAIHLTSHPEYREFISLLSLYKDEPVLYTYINLPGFDSKITKDVEIQKAFVCYLRADEYYKLNEFETALSFIHDSINLSPREYAYYKLWEILKALGRIDEAEEAFQVAERMRLEMEQK
jgi:sulfatase maturation enzyme AslB (radical SAM superfamily)